MDESAPLWSKLRADLTDNQSVTLTAIALALVLFGVLSLDSSPLPVSSDFGAEFLLGLSLMDLAFAYDDYWPVEYRPVYAVVWTLLMGVMTVVVFLGVYELGLSHLGSSTASIAAFVLAVGLQFVSGVLCAHIR
jgi:hypothetical protein